MPQAVGLVTAAEHLPILRYNYMVDFSREKGPLLTLVDLCRLMRHLWKLVLSISVSCALVAALVSLLMPSRFESSATITVSDPSSNVSSANLLAVVNDFVQTAIAPYAVSDSNVEATVGFGTDASAQTLILTIEGTSEDECVQLANSIANNAANDSKEVFDLLQEANEADLADLSALNTSEDVASVLSGTLLQNSLGSDRTFEFCSFMVNEAIEAEDIGPGVLTVALVGLAGGVFLAIIVVLLIDAVKRPIKSCEEIEENYELPVLSSRADSSMGERVWANVQFATSEPILSICLIPLGTDVVKEYAESLESAVVKQGLCSHVVQVPENAFLFTQKHDGIPIYSCFSVSSGVGAAYCAHEATATVICAHVWKDSHSELKETIRALSLAEANIAGIVLSE